MKEPAPRRHHARKAARMTMQEDHAKGNAGFFPIGMIDAPGGAGSGPRPTPKANP
jgi:hypothetical protein